MTDIPEEAVEAAARAINPHGWDTYDQIPVCTPGREETVAPSIRTATECLAAAEPYMRRKWAEEVRALRAEAAGLDALVSRALCAGYERAVKHASNLLEGGGNA